MVAKSILPIKKGTGTLQSSLSNWPSKSMNKINYKSEIVSTP